MGDGLGSSVLTERDKLMQQIIIFNLPVIWLMHQYDASRGTTALKDQFFY